MGIYETFLEEEPYSDEFEDFEFEDFEQAYFDTPQSCEDFAEALKEYYKAHPRESNKPRNAAESVLMKIGERLGTNPGGWYEDQQTKEKYYVKFYENPDQARVEFIANAIYKRLGIKAPESTLSGTDKKRAISSKEIPNAKGTYLDTQAKNPDVRNGFVADAYLANWDVVGLVYDNIVENESGMWRIDNGGSMVFRAQGGEKEFSPDNIPELESMLDTKYPAGKVFTGITEEELTSQARQLIRKLDEKTIDKIIDESGLTGEIKEKIVAGLKGRRNFLIEKFRYKSEERIPVSMEKLKEQEESLKTLELAPRVGLLADSDKIENQEVDLIYLNGKYILNFKLTSKHYEDVLEHIKAKIESNSAEGVLNGYIYYNKNIKKDQSDKNEDDEGEQKFSMTTAIVIKKEDIEIKISDYPINRSAIGLVQVEIAPGDSLNAAEIGKKVNNLFISTLEIPEGLTPPNQEAEKEYKKARYAWHHKLDATLPDSFPEDMESRLTREEVFPGYFTFVEKDKWREYQAMSQFAVCHKLYSTHTLPKIMKAGGLISTHERYRRGLLYDGSSSRSDIEGGAPIACL